MLPLASTFCSPLIFATSEATCSDATTREPLLTVMKSGSLPPPSDRGPGYGPAVIVPLASATSPPIEAGPTLLSRVTL